MAGSFSLVTRSGHPDFLDLPWDEPLGSWAHPRLVRMAHGLSRHVVRFVNYGDAVYALKETTEGLAVTEFRSLLAMRDDGLPVVDAVGTVTGRRRRDGEELPGIVITRFLDYALPYQYLFAQGGGPELRSPLLDAGALLLVRLHLLGVYWGDCSLANVLFRRDAGGLMAYLVDAETVELFPPPLGDGLRAADLELAAENVAGGLLDLQLAGRIGSELDPAEVVEDLRARYEALWNELTRTDRIAGGERHRIEERIRRLNDLGFDVDELAVESTDGGDTLRVRPVVVEEGHHARELKRRTGLEVQENQARRLLCDIAAYGAWLEEDTGRPVPEAVAAARWLSEVYEPIVARVPDELRGRLDAPELFHELLEHRWLRGEEEGREIDNEEALQSYLATVLAQRAYERTLLDAGDGDGDGDGEGGG